MHWFINGLLFVAALAGTFLVGAAVCQVVMNYVGIREAREFEEWDRKNRAEHLRLQREQEAVNFQLHGINASDYLDAITGGKDE